MGYQSKLFPPKSSFVTLWIQHLMTTTGVCCRFTVFYCMYIWDTLALSRSWNRRKVGLKNRGKKVMLVKKYLIIIIIIKKYLIMHKSILRYLRVLCKRTILPDLLSESWLLTVRGYYIENNLLIRTNNIKQNVKTTVLIKILTNFRSNLIFLLFVWRGWRYRNVRIDNFAAIPI